MKAFDLNISTVIARFYLMMAIVIAAGFLGQWWLAALALPVFLSIMLGVSFNKKDTNNEARIRNMNKPAEQTKKVG